MSWLWWTLAGLYLSVGAVLATALSLLDGGTRGGGSQLELGDLLRWPLIAVFWLPWLVLKALQLAAVLLLPVSWTRKW